MSQVVSSQQKNASGTISKSGGLLIASTLWVIQGLLALIFLFAGGMKLITPIETLAALMPLPLPGLFLRFIGTAEVAGAIGLILPTLLRIRPGLTPLAACGLVIIMIGATGYTVLSGSLVGALMPLLVGLFCLSVVYGRQASLIADPLFGRFFRKPGKAS
ncbi:DoxX family protein [Dictyobacter formicarum]|uniref:DoxX family protein n=1 Tax=Dictyobacter formicarum TaxID=2778368 RepID=A0ABQ3VQI6_9CHLR|nr:DoxX family protein [Dictyobacter formicarum]GHO88405.1 hypothetical protein KSZ_64110 [Dictyobacter formicarum]